MRIRAVVQRRVLGLPLGQTLTGYGLAPANYARGSLRATFKPLGDAMYPSAELRAQAVMAGLTATQAKAAAQYGPVLVLAGAGTGKTKTLTAAVLHRIAESPVASDRILAVTFTNKAATEMSIRIRAALDGGPVPSWLGTFHGLAARQLRIEPEVAGLRPGFDILDADDSRRLVKQTLKALNLAKWRGGCPYWPRPAETCLQPAVQV